jgi:phosphate transport system protein
VPKHLEREIESLRKRLLHVGAIVEETLRAAADAVLDRDEKAAAAVIAGDDVLDRMEVEIEEDCLKVLALHQPVATDLRLIVAALKINNDLERIGDYAVNVAERAQYLTTHEPVPPPFDLAAMAEKCCLMLNRCLDSFVKVDSQIALDVCRSDDEVDAIHRGVYDAVQARSAIAPLEVGRLLHWVSISRYLERVADHATNIAEDVIYMLDGEIVRHRLRREAKAGGWKTR